MTRRMSAVAACRANAWSSCLVRRSSWVARSESFRNLCGRDFRTMRDLVVLAVLAFAALVVLRPSPRPALLAPGLLALLPFFDTRAIPTSAPVAPYRAR